MNLNLKGSKMLTSRLFLVGIIGFTSFFPTAFAETPKELVERLNQRALVLTQEDADTVREMAKNKESLAQGLEAFKAELEEQQRFESTLQEFAQLAGTGKYDQAAKMLEDQIANTKSEELKTRWVMIRHQFNLMSGRAKEADFQFYRDQMKEQKGIPQAVHQTSVMLYSVHQNGGKIGPLAGEAIVALQAELKGLEIPEGQAALYSAMARLYTVEGKLAEAIAAQEKAVAATSDLPRSEQQRQKLLLEDLKSQAEQASKKK